LADDIIKLRDNVNEIKQLLKNVSTNNLNKKSDKSKIRNFVSDYFSGLRPNLTRFLGDEILKDLDEKMQDLLKLTQQNSKRSDFMNIIKRCTSIINSLEIQIISDPSSFTVSFSYGNEDNLIIETLNKISIEAALCYEQGLLDLNDNKRRSWRGTAVEFREALRLTLDILAPDDIVRKSTTADEDNNHNKPTMREKASYILRERKRMKAQIKTSESILDLIDSTMGSLVRSVYDRASAGVHSAIGKPEAQHIKEYVTLILKELLEI